jgi:putative FmdB family regulatory protein
MPMFDWTCMKCLKIFEAVVKVADLDKEMKCPHCGEPIKRLVSAPRRINIH